MSSPCFRAPIWMEVGKRRRRRKLRKPLRAVERERNRRKYIYARVNDEDDVMFFRGCDVSDKKATRGVYHAVGAYLSRILCFSFFCLKNGDAWLFCLLPHFSTSLPHCSFLCTGLWPKRAFNDFSYDTETTPNTSPHTIS